MATHDDYLDLLNQIATLRAQLADRQATERPGESAIAERIATKLGEVQQKVTDKLSAMPPPSDFGHAELIGLGSDAKPTLGAVRTGLEVEPYDETVTSERIYGIADLYYQYQFERIGVFRAVLKLQQLFKAGQVRLSSGEGAVGLLQAGLDRGHGRPSIGQILGHVGGAGDQGTLTIRRLDDGHGKTGSLPVDNPADGSVGRPLYLQE